MANKNLTGQTIADSYDQLLITADENGITGSGTSATQIMTGTGVAGAGGALVVAGGTPANATVAASVGASAGTGPVTGDFTYTCVDNARAGESQPELV